MNIQSSSFSVIFTSEYTYLVLSVVIFDLKSSEMYERKIDETSGKPKTSRTPIFPAEWKNQFGLPVEEHKKQLQIDLFNGFAIFGLEDKKNTNTDINNFEGNNNE